MDFEIEQIPAVDNVARFIIKPNHYVAEEFSWDKAFKFPKKIEEGESVCWERYASTEHAKHEAGNEVLKKILVRKPDATYIGFRTANVGSIRSLKSAKGHSFDVIHKPCNGEGQHHAEVVYLPSQEDDLKSIHRAELKEMLEGVFAPTTNSN